MVQRIVAVKDFSELTGWTIFGYILDQSVANDVAGGDPVGGTEPMGTEPTEPTGLEGGTEPIGTEPIGTDPSCSTEVEFVGTSSIWVTCEGDVFGGHLRYGLPVKTYAKLFNKKLPSPPYLRTPIIHDRHAHKNAHTQPPNTNPQSANI